MKRANTTLLMLLLLINITTKAYANTPPVSNAGHDLQVDENSLVTLDATVSYDPDKDPLTYSWIQMLGIAVTLSDSTSPTPTFTAPEVGTSGETIIFHLEVSDGIHTSLDGVIITVNNVTAALPSITGFTPSDSPIGTTVTITGTNFTTDTPGETYTYINNTPANILSLTNTAITTTIPQGATTGLITVATPDGTAVSLNNFTVTANPPPLVSPTAYIKGSILDSKTNRPIEGANITVKNLPDTILTDINGKFIYSVPQGGEYVLYLEKQGYVTAKQTRISRL